MNNDFTGQKPTEAQPGLGRVYIPDDRDFEYTPMRSLSSGLLVPRETPDVDAMYWGMSDLTDQGSSSHCVAHQANYVMSFYPLPYLRSVLTPEPQVYDWCQLNDPWPGTETTDPRYYGTSERTGLDFYRKDGLITSYHRLSSPDELIMWLLTYGPVATGISWKTCMYSPNPLTGLITYEKSSPVQGGHAIIIYGCNTRRKTFSFQNSWGAGWGKGGRCMMSFDAVQDLIFTEDGAAYGIQKKSLGIHDS